MQYIKNKSKKRCLLNTYATVSSEVFLQPFHKVMVRGSTERSCHKMGFTYIAGKVMGNNIKFKKKIIPARI